MNALPMNTLPKPLTEPARLGLFALLQVAVMLVAISNESLWIDEFWTAHFGAMPSFKSFYELLIVPSGSQTPLHFLHFYLWGQLSPASEFVFRLANLPMFVVGQLALYAALRDQPKPFAYSFLALSALHPMVWQYANEARPYLLMVAGAQMMLAYLLRLHNNGTRHRPTEPVFLLLFVVGGILLFGASLLGAFWVFAAGLYVLVHHLRSGTWRALLRGVNLLLVAALLLATAVLTAYYLSSLLKGAGGSRLASSSLATMLFAGYELLGLAGIGPGRLELRTLGITALAPYTWVLSAAAAVLLWILTAGVREARTRLGTGTWLWLGALSLFPVLVVLFSGFAMSWRVLGRHLIAALPVLNLLLALGLTALWQTPRGPRVRVVLFKAVAVAGGLALVCSALALRFSPQHRKDDYRAAAALAQAAAAQGQRVWWAADVIGARYYGLPGDFDVMGELTGQHRPLACFDLPGVQAVANASANCLAALSIPDWVVLSKPETFDTQGDIAHYLKAQRFTVVQVLPAFTLWRQSAGPAAPKP